MIVKPGGVGRGQTVIGAKVRLRWNYKDILEYSIMAQPKPVGPASQPVGTLPAAPEPAGALVKPTKVVMGRPVAPNQVDPPVADLMGYLD